MSIRLTQVELQSEEDTVIFLASGHLNCVEQVKPLLEAENFLEDHDGEDIEVSLSHYLYGDEGPAYDADQNHIDFAEQDGILIPFLILFAIFIDIQYYAYRGATTYTFVPRDKHEELSKWMPE